CRRRTAAAPAATTGGRIEKGVVNPRLEAPALRRLDVGVLVMTVVLNLVFVAAEPNHQHVDLPARAFRRRVDDVVDVDVLDALADPAGARAAVGPPAGHLGQRLASLRFPADLPVLKRGEKAIRRK